MNNNGSRSLVAECGGARVKTVYRGAGSIPAESPKSVPPFDRTQRHFLSLGAGVQSSTIALMAAKGEIGPMPEAAIIADTKHEPRAVYAWLDWLEKQLPYPVIRVTAGDLWKSATNVRRTQDGERTYISTGIPVFFTGSEGGELTTRKGIGKRQCTRDFKTNVITRQVKQLVGLKRVSKKTPTMATTWIGISADEPHRAKPSREHWITKRFPLLELDMDREDCLEWMRDNGYPVPPRSACTFCPFHDDNSWLALEPDELVAVAQKEKELQAAYARTTAIQGVPYFHESRVPLLEVKFQPTAKHTTRQRKLFGAECEGMCGV